jgi:hypothetical protein
MHVDDLKCTSKGIWYLDIVAAGDEDDNGPSEVFQRIASWSVNAGKPQDGDRNPAAGESRSRFFQRSGATEDVACSQPSFSA